MLDLDLTGRVALITAGSKGLGARMALELAELGADVAVTYVRDRQAAAGVVKQIRARGRGALSVKADARDFDRAHEVVAEVGAKLGGLHILVCNAAAGAGGALWKQSEREWDEAMDVSLKGAFNYIHAAAPGFMAQQGGKIVCTGSINGLRGRMGTVGYNVAKAGLAGLVKTAASELGRYNVNVNLVAPGFIEAASQAGTPELIRDLVLKECAIKRLCGPEDIVPLMVFLCTDAARHITGQTIKVDAGQYL